MKKHLGLILLVVMVAAAGGASFPLAKHTATGTPSQDVANQIVAREKAAFEAWQRKAYYDRRLFLEVMRTGRVARASSIRSR